LPSQNEIFLDGKKITIEAYTVGGYNHLKIRDFATALGVPLEFSTATGEISLTTAPPPKDYGLGKVAAFSAKDLAGNTVTNSVFQGKPLTFINYWATWCGPCRQELPDFPALVEQYGDKVCFITVIDDAENNANAKKLADEYLKGCINLLPADGLLESLESGYVPTSILVNRDGYLVAEQIVGAYGSAYTSFLDAALQMVAQ
jgi:thiol-disulfide isomerase/thioredoxin